MGEVKASNMKKTASSDVVPCVIGQQVLVAVYFPGPPFPFVGVEEGWGRGRVGCGHVTTELKVSD